MTRAAVRTTLPGIIRGTGLDPAGLVYRGLRSAWRGLRHCHLRLLRRQPALLLVLDGPPRLQGVGAITGWVLSRDARVVCVEARVGGKLLASRPPTEWRPDIAVQFPYYRGHGPQGFRLAPPPELLTNGRFPLELRALDARGRSIAVHTRLEVAEYRIPDAGELPPHLRGSNREYQLWRRAHGTGIQEVGSGDGVAKTSCDSRISVVMPIYKPDLQHLRKAIESVLEQHHTDWDLCLCDDGSNDPGLHDYLKGLSSSDQRFQLTTHPQNRGIAAATNTAIGLATGKWIAFLDQDDRLAPEALAAIAATRTEADVIYSDWDRIDAHGCHTEPFFKPDWSPDLLRSMMYLAHLTVYRRAFLERIGLCRSEFDGTQDWELALRAARHTDRIVHVPQVLYHWRLGGVSAGADFNRTCHERGRRALAEHAGQDQPSRRVEVQDGPTPCTFHVRYRYAEWPLVSLLIPTRDNVRLLKRCMHGLRHRTDYPRIEILVIDNGSRDPATQRYLRSCGERVLHYDIPFNHSRLNNLAAREARGEVLVLLNDDVEVQSREWLTALVEQALRPRVGAVGAWLFHPDERIQHAGVITGLGPVARPLCSAITGDGIDRGTARLIRNVSAVTGACLAIRRQLYLEIGGLDEEALPTSFNDVDLCLRLRQAGYVLVQQPLARLYHHESATRQIGDESRIVRLMWERWGEQLARDPYWNPNLPHGEARSGFAFHWVAGSEPCMQRSGVSGLAPADPRDSSRCPVAARAAE